MIVFKSFVELAGFLFSPQKSLVQISALKPVKLRILLIVLSLYCKTSKYCL